MVIDEKEIKQRKKLDEVNLCFGRAWPPYRATLRVDAYLP